jgi:hypothetical protein
MRPEDILEEDDYNGLDVALAVNSKKFKNCSFDI